MRYEAIGFDYNGVLSGKPSSFFGEQICNALGVTNEQYLEAYFHHNKKINRNEITWPQLWELVLAELGKIEKLPEVIRLSEEARADHLNHDVLEVVDKVRSLGYKTGLLSNHTVEGGKRLRQAGIDAHFDVFHISAETGYVKPEPEAFRYLAQELGVAVDALIFIDDSEKSLSTAKTCGFTPVLFEDAAQLRQSLTRLGVDVGS